MGNTPLSEDQLEAFHQNGYLLVPGVFSEKKCQDFMKTVVLPHLAQYPDLNSLTEFATGEYDANKHHHGDNRLPGLMIRNQDGSGPLSNESSQFILRNEKLLTILDFLHDGGKNNNASWKWLHSENVGWIHVRLPIDNPNDYEYRWHVDGGHFSPHKLVSSEQSVVVLPMLDDVEHGNTVVLPGSHHYMAQLLNQRELSKDITQDCRELARAWPHEDKEIVPCRAGDALILHPFLVHAAGFHTNHQVQKLRITFNLGTKWTKTCLDVDNPKSWLEQSIQRSLTEKVPDLSDTVDRAFRID